MTDDFILAQLFGSESESIPYRPRMGKVLGSTNAAILLQQMTFNWKRAKRRVFYKFQQPCTHRLYKPEDSWTEELCWSVDMFKTALGKIGKRAHTKQERDMFLRSSEKEFCVVYMVDRDNMSWFYINEKAVANVLRQTAMLDNERELRLERNSPVLQNGESPIPLGPESTPEKNITSDFLEDKSNVTVLEAKEPKKLPPLKQTTFILDKYAKKMPIDFKLKPDIMKDALELGYEAIDIQDESVKFIKYYTNGKGTSTRYRDWNHQFLYGWLNNGYHNGNLKRNGQFYKLNANNERRESITKLSDPNLFAHITD